MGKPLMGRITVDEKNRVVGTGGSPFASLAIVEDRNGKRIGMSTMQDAQAALEARRPLEFYRL